MHAGTGSMNREICVVVVRGLCWLLIMTLLGCGRAPSPPPSRALEGDAPSADRVPRGRIIPNLVLHEDSEKGAEFWVKLEIGLNGMSADTLAMVQSALQRPISGPKLKQLEALIWPRIDRDARVAFRQMIHCAFQDNLEIATSTGAQPKCPDPITQ